MLKTVTNTVYLAFTAIAFFTLISVTLTAIYFYNRIDRDLPKIETVSDYRPKAVTQFFSSDGTMIAEVWDERRYPVALKDIPAHVKNAFLAAEDASFYEHGGIDPFGIVRAAWVNAMAGRKKQGASTITQQIVKELLLSRERTFERKAKEALLSYRLEANLSKDEILSIYLNQIFLGKGAYGIKAAAKAHFRKDLSELTIAEAAFLGGLPKKPSDLSKKKNRPAAVRRQYYVLDQMLDKKFITQEQYEEAKAQELVIYEQDEENIFHAPYFSTFVIHETDKIIQEAYPELSIRDPGGYKVYTSVDLNAYKAAERAVKKRLKEVDKRQGWRGSLGNIKESEEKNSFTWTEFESVTEIEPGRIYKALVSGINRRKGTLRLSLGEVTGGVNLKKASWAGTRVVVKPQSTSLHRFARRPESDIKPGDIIEVSTTQKNIDAAKDGVVTFKLDQTPLAQAAFAAIEAHTGNILSLIGGFDFRQSKFNRATQALLQPGSSFKPFIYLAAIDKLGLTPSSLVPDEPISFPTPQGLWLPQNFDKKFLGPITLRTALQRSRNVVSVHLLHRVGIDTVIGLAKSFGISTDIPRNMSISLGTPEVKLMDMVRAYAGFATSGFVPDIRSVLKVVDRSGEVVLSKEPNQTEVIDQRSAFILQHVMRGVVDRGTAQVVKKLGRPVAGKTGTTNDHMDAWFIGYTPDVVAGGWVGFDVKRSLGRSETGGRAAGPIFLDFMTDYLGESPITDFIPPDGVTPVAVNVRSGVPISPNSDGAFIEYFKTESLSERDQYDFYGSSELVPRSIEESDYLKSSDF